jgi:hypothetical protein
MLLAALVLGPPTFSWSALAVFLVTAGVTLCAGHSVGFHRRLIHRSFDCPNWLEPVLVWFGTAVGMGGPIWMIRLHDSRDWAQRQPNCHWFLRHAKPLLLDGFYYLNFRLELAHPPRFDPGPGSRTIVSIASSIATGVAAGADHDPALRARRTSVASLRRVRPGGDVHDDALAHLLFRAHPRPTGLDSRWRSDPGL